jgi:Ca2+-transporting ATPase
MNARYAGRRPPSRAPVRPWTIEALGVARALATDPASGLSTAEASARLQAVGPNELLERQRVRPWRLLAGQFTNTMIVVLVIAAAVTAIIGDLKDSIIILTIVALNGVIGFVQEYRADRAMAALKEMTSPTARALRDGEVAVIAAGQLVPGDIIRLEAGDVVPADLRLLGPTSIRVNESALTGESEPATKTVDALPAVADGALGDQRNMAFKGTSVTYGRASGIAVATGMATALGRIADLMQQHEAGPTPLQARLSALGRGLTAAALIVCAVIFLAALARVAAACNDAVLLAPHRSGEPRAAIGVWRR